MENNFDCGEGVVTLEISEAKRSQGEPLGSRRVEIGRVAGTMPKQSLKCGKFCLENVQLQ